MSGEQRLGILPRSRKWQRIADMVVRGAGAPAIADATLRNLRDLIEKRARHPAVARPVSAIAGMVSAARAGDEAGFIQHAAWQHGPNPSVVGLMAAFGEWLDGRWPDDPKKTDMVEYAYGSAVAAFTLGMWAPSTSDGGPVAAAMVRAAEPDAFGKMVASFFARLVRMPLADMLARAVAAAAGRDHENGVAYYIRGEKLQADLRTHCETMARAVVPFAETWVRAGHWSDGERARRFVAYAVFKVCSELRDAGISAC